MSIPLGLPNPPTYTLRSCCHRTHWNTSRPVTEQVNFIACTIQIAIGIAFEVAARTEEICVSVATGVEGNGPVVYGRAFGNTDAVVDGISAYDATSGGAL